MDYARFMHGEWGNRGDESILEGVKWTLNQGVGQTGSDFDDRGDEERLIAARPIKI